MYTFFKIYGKIENGKVYLLKYFLPKRSAEGGIMKNRRLLTVFLLLLLSLSIALTACGGGGDGTGNTDTPGGTDTPGNNGDQGGGTPEVKQLATPFVSIDAEGNASWAAISNASGYTYKISGGNETNTTSTSVKLTDGQTIEVKAVGDGVSFTDSAWSSAQKYEAPLPAEPTVLATPVVNISASGLASWAAIPNASGYEYKLGGATQTTASTSIQLTDGQSIEVRAIGDGTNYASGAWSASATYTAPVQVIAPTYLGMLATNTAPTETGGIPSIILPSTVRSRLLANGIFMPFGDVLDNYFLVEENRLGDELPPESTHDVYAKPTETVYIQIWLNNPEQKTIISLKLNGNKYQVGGGLSSFFITKDGVHYNCVYVAVPIPEGEYGELSYTVSDIEYISGMYINSDGTDDFMNNNNTVTVGLPYEPDIPTVSDLTTAGASYNSLSATFSLSDTALADLCGGWLGVAVYDGSRIISNKAITSGENTVNISGLIEDSYYSLRVYLYGDLNDGNGVTAHTLCEYGFTTESVFERFTVEGVIAYDELKERYLGKIKLDLSFISPSAEFIKVEIYNDDYENPQLIATVEDFDGTLSISDGILNGRSYNIKIYYKDTEYPEGKCRETNAWVSSLGEVYSFDEEYYSIYNDLVFSLNLGNNDENYAHISDFKMYIFNKNSANYNADLILEYIDNPGIKEELEAAAEEKWQLMYNANVSGDYELGDVYRAEYDEINDKINKLSDALYALEYRYENNMDREFWEAEKAKGKYAYILDFSAEGGSAIFKVGKVYYAVISGFYELQDWQSYEYEIIAGIDKNDGNGIVTDRFSGSLHHTHIFTQFNGLITNDVTVSEGSISYTLFNRDNYDDLGEYYTTDLGYVWKIVATRGYQYSDDYKEVTLYECLDIPAFGENKDEWLAAYIAAVKSGADISGLISEFVGEYEQAYSIPVDLSKLTVHGGWDIHIYTRLYSAEYTEDELFDQDNTVSYTRTVKIGTPSVTIEGHDAVVLFPDEGWYIVYYNIKNESGELISENVIGDQRIYIETVGYQIQVRLESYEDGLTPSDWSEWITFEGERLTVQFNEYNTNDCSVSWYSDIEVAGWVYTINGGEEITLSPEACSVMLRNGDVLRVRAKAVEGTDYIDSAWTEFICVDERTELPTPKNVELTYENGIYRLQWTMESTDGVSGYYIYADGEICADAYARFDESSGVWGADIYKLTVGAKYQVQAIAEDQATYRSSAFSESVSPDITLTDPTFSSMSGTTLRWGSVQYADSYWYRINEDGEEIQANPDSPTRTRLDISAMNLEVGDEIWLQARADGCTSSNWVLLWSKS